MASEQDAGASTRLHSRAVLQALFVTFLWSTSWIFIKIGLEDIPALPFAGLRYVLAFIALVPFVLRRPQLAALRGLSRKIWLQLILLGLIFYGVTQGTQFLGLFYLPAITVSLMLSFTPILVALLGGVFLGEKLTRQQWAGTGLYVIGVLIYFYPAVVPAGQLIGLIVVLVGVLANAASSILGRNVNRQLTIPPEVVTVVSMGFGAFALLIVGSAVQGLPPLNLTSWAIILWLAIVNSAFAFTLWNHTLRTLPAVESSIINNTMLIQIPILAWLFLGEEPTALEIAGMILAGLGILIVQLRRQTQH
jgi:drug/metabolite transporter (DMT)-like permease